LRGRSAGTGFVQGATVTFGNDSGTGVQVAPSRIDVATPAHAAGKVPVTVTNPDLSQITVVDAFEYVAASLSVQQGPAAGGTQVTIRGAGFTAGTSVTFGGAPAKRQTGGDDRTLIVQTPEHSPGSVDVVINNSGEAPVKLSGSFAFV
jgi:IPT/TIG domain